MAQTRCLVIGSCTGKKDDKGCPTQLKLTEKDFSTAERCQRAEAAAASWMKPAGEMYKGRQHILMMEGVRCLRSDFSGMNIDVAIISAGYGVLTEKRHIAPYDITFQGKPASWIRDRGQALCVPEDVRSLLPQYQVVFFLLGKEYLASIGTLPIPTVMQKFFYFGDAAARMSAPTKNAIIVPAGPEQVQRYKGAGVTGIKGRMFSLLASGLSATPFAWERLLNDASSKTLLAILDQARASETRNA